MFVTRRVCVCRICVGAHECPSDMHTIKKDAHDCPCVCRLRDYTLHTSTQALHTEFRYMGRRWWSVIMQVSQGCECARTAVGHVHGA